jgi:hypothetical protein
MAYLTILLIAPTNQHRMTARLMNIELEKIEKKR